MLVNLTKKEITKDKIKKIICDILSFIFLSFIDFIFGPNAIKNKNVGIDILVFNAIRFPNLNDQNTVAYNISK